MLAVLAVSAVASASASANNHKYYINGGAIVAAETVKGTVGKANLNSKIAGDKTEIECTKNKIVSFEIEPGGKSKGEITFEECGHLYTYTGGKRTSQANCPVIEPIKFAFKDKLIEGPGGVEEDEFEPAVAGNPFVTIEIGSTGTGCVLKGKYEVTGTYVASGGIYPAPAGGVPGGELEAVEHEQVFTSESSKIKFGSEKASFTAKVTEIKLSGANVGKGWYVE